MGEGDEFEMGSDQDGGDQEHQMLNIDHDDSDDYEPAIQKNKPQMKQTSPKKGNEGLENTEKVENQPFDEAVEINDSEELDSEEDDDEHYGHSQAKGSQGAP